MRPDGERNRLDARKSSFSIAVSSSVQGVEGKSKAERRCLSFCSTLHCADYVDDLLYNESIVTRSWRLFAICNDFN